MFCRPFKNAIKGMVIQKFGVNPQPYQPNGHTGLDFASIAPLYGTFLVAPEDVIIKSIVGIKTVGDDTVESFKRGFGLLMRGEKYIHCYWHCLPVFPVSVGQVVKQGQPVAQIGNSGFTYSGGGLTDPNTAIKSKAGTHLHWEVFTEENGARKFIDPLPLIDWNIKISYDVLKVVQELINKLKNIILGNK